MYLGAGIGNVYVLLGRRILDGKPNIQGEELSPLSFFHRAKRNIVETAAWER